MRYLALLFTLFCLSCSPPALTFRVDDAFTPEQKVEIWNAAARWNDVSNKPIMFGPDGAWRISRAALPSWASGMTWPAERYIVIAPDVPDVYRVTLHEFGHALGLTHTQGGIMNWTDTGSPDLTDTDLRECRRVGACD